MNAEEKLVAGSWILPERKTFIGKYCKLEPLDTNHRDQLYTVCTVPDASARYQYLLEMPGSEPDAFDEWFSSQRDQYGFAVIDKATGRVEGKQNLIPASPENGVMEIGGIIWGPNIAKTWVTTEAFFLMTCYVFDELKYRRYQWKCSNENVPSKNAAVRLGFQFEGVLRQFRIVNGRNRDTTYFSMLDREWPAIKPTFEKWLDESNFDERGQQRRTLSSFRD